MIVSLNETTPRFLHTTKPETIISHNKCDVIITSGNSMLKLVCDLVSLPWKTHTCGIIRMKILIVLSIVCRNTKMVDNYKWK